MRVLAISLAAPPDSQESDPRGSIDRSVERGKRDGQGALEDAGTLESELAAETVTHVEVEPLDIEFQSLTSLRLHPDGDLLACDGMGKQIKVISPDGRITRRRCATRPLSAGARPEKGPPRAWTGRLPGVLGGRGQRGAAPEAGVQSRRKDGTSPDASRRACAGARGGPGPSTARPIARFHGSGACQHAPHFQGALSYNALETNVLGEAEPKGLTS